MRLWGDIEFPDGDELAEREVLAERRQIDAASSARRGVRRTVDYAQKSSAQSRGSVAGFASSRSE